MTFTHTSTRHALLVPLAALTLLLLFVFATRAPLLNTLEMDSDEVWSVWQTFGTPAQIVEWTPYDWLPTYYLMIGAWRSVMGFHPIVLRLFTLFAFMLGVTALYKAGNRLQGRRLGILAALVFAALSYNVFTSLHVRGSAIALALLPFVLWFTLRYFARPTLRRAIPLALAMALISWIYLNSPIALAVIGVLTLVLFPRKIWRWWLPGSLYLALIVPVLINKLDLIIGRTGPLSSRVQPAFIDGITTLYNAYFGTGYTVWLVIAGIALVAAIVYMRRRASSRLFIGLTLWALGTPLALFVLNPILGFFGAHYSWFVLPGLALWIAFGLAVLPQPLLIASGVVVTALTFTPLNLGWYALHMPTVAANFDWLAARYQAGDAVLIDPNCRCTDAHVWDYHRSVRFPEGLHGISQPGDERRIWYVSTDGEQDAQIVNAVRDGRRAGEFIGTWEFLFRLYEAPPNSEGVQFENGMRFHGMDVINENGEYETGLIARREGEPLRLQLWWSADAPPPRDYSVGVYVLYNGTLIAQSNSAPQVAEAPIETSRWPLDTTLTEVRTLQLPAYLATGDYDLALAVYTFEDNGRVVAPGMTDENTLLPLGQFSVHAW